jgi:hypothetical protein
LIYLTGAIGPTVKQLAAEGLVGMVAQPMSSYAPEEILKFPCYAADNACFANKNFSEEKWLAWLDRMPRETCLFAAAPDIVGDARATMIRSAPWLPKIRDLGYKAAFVGQNGLENMVVPWDDFDCFFIGGEDVAGQRPWKLGYEAVALVQEARERGKWVHMGRVNSEKRLAYAAYIGCDSADGTFLKYAPEHNVGRMLRWFSNMRANPTLPLYAVEGEFG